MSIRLASQQGVYSTNRPQMLSVVGSVGPAVITTPSLVASATYTIASAGLVGIYTFTGTGSLVVATGGLVDILAIGGGGGGASQYDGTQGTGGGGAGGYMFLENFFIPAGTYTVTIGGGGAKGAAQYAVGTRGNPTYIENFFLSPGGGGGGNANRYAGESGGSGGGGSYNGALGGFSVLLTSGNLRGNSGGAGVVGNSGGGGGGGASQTGSGGSGANGGKGGNGLPNNIVNGTTNTYYCGGGAGSGGVQASGGLGGGGTANSSTLSNGTANTGGGGGAGLTSVANTGNGGSGYLVIRVRL